MNQIVAEKKHIQKQLKLPYANLSQSYLRAETALGTQSNINFVLQAGKKNTSPLVSERLLELNDQFVITHFFVGLAVVAADSPSDLQQLSKVVHTWEDPTTFAGANSVNVAAIYGGSLNFTINRKEFVPQFPVRAFRRVPETQTASNADYTASGISTVNSYANGLTGFYPCEPTLIDGRQTLDVSIELGSSVSFDDASKAVYCVFEARGYLLVNAKS